MTITALPFRTAIAVVVIAVFAAISITPTRAQDTPPDSTTATGAESTSSSRPRGKSSTTVPPETTTTAATSTTTGATTTTSATTTTTAATTTTTSATTTTTTTGDATTTTGATTTTTGDATTTSTLPLEAEGDEVEVDEIAPDEDACNPEDDPSAVDTDGSAADEAKADGSSTTVTTSPAADSSDKVGAKGTVDGKAVPTDADADPCNPDEDELGFTPVVRIKTVRDIVFPIVGRAGYYDGFGACRDGCTREHHGIDIGTFGWKGLPVVASHDGVVIRTTYDQRLAGCAVVLRGEDGWQTRYVHLNTDFPGTDTNGYTCLAPGVELGAEVVAGQIIGWVGDSGNAENTIPHIHFEIRNPAGVPVNAYQSLKAARTIEFDWLSQDPSDAYNSIVAANHTNGAETAVIISATEARKLSADENAASAYDTPVIVIDESNPDSALEQIERLELDRAIVMSDHDSAWISELVTPLVGLVETERFPLPYTPPVRMMPDTGDTIPPEPNPVDRFATIIARSDETDTVPVVETEVPTVETEGDPEAIEAAAEAAAEAAEAETVARAKAEAAYLEAFEEYTVNHRSVVLAAGSEAVSDLSSVEGPAPTRNDESQAPSLTARRASNTGTLPTPLPLWWNIGDGWVWTDDPLDMPGRGIVYLTDAQATPWTLAFLTSLVEVDPVPLWRG